MKSPEFLMTRGANGAKRKISWPRLAGTVLLIGGLGTLATMIMFAGDKDTKEAKAETEQEVKDWKPNLPMETATTQKQEEKATEARKEEEKADEEEEDETPPDPRIAILMNAAKTRVKPFQGDLKRLEEFQKVAMASGVGGSCEILPGDKAFLRPIDFINTDNGGTVVAELAESIPGHGCDIAMEAGAKFVGFVDSNVQFGQSRSNIAFQTITTTDDQVIDIDNMAGDSMGTGGVPGRVDRHMGSTLAGVALATGVDLGSFALAGAGGGYALVMTNGGSVVDDFARLLLNRKDTITRDPTRSPGLITVTFTQRISTNPH